MVKKFLFCMSLSKGASIMAASNLLFAIVALIAASVKLYEKQTKADELYLILTVIMGALNLFIGIIMVVALIKGNEKYIFLYLILELSNLIIISTFAGINLFVYRTALIGFLTVVCIFLWYGLWCMFSFYLEMVDYNTVKSGVIEITCNTNVNPVLFPEKAVESTAV